MEWFGDFLFPCVACQDLDCEAGHAIACCDSGLSPRSRGRGVPSFMGMSPSCLFAGLLPLNCRGLLKQPSDPGVFLFGLTL